MNMNRKELLQKVCMILHDAEDSDIEIYKVRDRHEQSRATAEGVYIVKCILTERRTNSFTEIY